MKKFIFLVLIAFVVIGSYYGYSSFIKKDQSGLDVPTAKVKRGDIENVVSATGKLEPKDYVDVGAQVSGQLSKLLVDVGDSVKKGDLLAQIDVTLFMAKVDAQRAQLKLQKASLMDKESQNELAKLNLERQKNLYEYNATTLEAYQTAQMAYKSSQAQLAMLRAQIEQIDSSLRLEEANLEFTRIYAPMDGTVVSLSAKQGQTLNANQQAPTILRIADLSRMNVRAEVSEADISRLKIGMDVYFKTLGKEKQWFSKLQKIEPTPTITNNVVLYNALFEIENPKQELMTSMTAQVFFLVASAKDTLVIPNSTLVIPDPKKRKKGEVKVRNEDGTLEVRSVVLGVTNRVSSEVKEGVIEGESLVVNLSDAKRRNTKPVVMPGMMR